MRSRQIGQILSPNRCRNQKNALKFHRPPAVVSFLADPPQAEKGGHHPVNFTRTEGPITLHQGLLCRRPETPKCWKPTGFGCVGLPAFCWSMIFESYSERGIYIYIYLFNHFGIIKTRWWAVKKFHIFKSTSTAFSQMHLWNIPDFWRPDSNNLFLPHLFVGWFAWTYGTPRAQNILSGPQMVSYVSSIFCWAMRRKKDWMKLTETLPDTE